VLGGGKLFKSLEVSRSVNSCTSFFAGSLMQQRALLRLLSVRKPRRVCRSCNKLSELSLKTVHSPKVTRKKSSET
jgi:hypothetical protein